MKNNIRPKTIFCDIDGTLVEHNPPHVVAKDGHCLQLLPGTIEKLQEWDKNGYNIILTTGRKESMRDVTVKQLEQVGIFYDHLIMGIGGGTRIIINDLKPNNDSSTAFAINIKRDHGIQDVEI